MQSGWYRRFVAPQCSVGWHRAAFAAALAISAAGCAGMSQPTRLSDGGGATLALNRSTVCPRMWPASSTMI